jgi:hypothetical protein
LPNRQRTDRIYRRHQQYSPGAWRGTHQLLVAGRDGLVETALQAGLDLDGPAV